jgi:hypothetical protein
LGLFAENEIPVVARPVEVNGTIDPSGTDKTTLIHENKDQKSIFRITTGTLTLYYVNFIHTNGSTSLHYIISVEGNGNASQ